MAYKSGARGNSRNFGLHGSPGKGCKDRTSDRRKFNEHFDEIKWGDGLTLSGRGVYFRRRVNQNIKLKQIMTTKHFIALAAAIKLSYLQAETPEARRAVAFTAGRIATVCMDHNPNFNDARFIEACGIKAD